MWGHLRKFLFGEARIHTNKDPTLQASAYEPNNDYGDYDEDDDDDDDEGVQWKVEKQSKEPLNEEYDDTYIESDSDDERQGYRVSVPKPQRPPPVLARIKDLFAPSLKAKLPKWSKKKNSKEKKKGAKPQGLRDGQRKAPLPAAATQHRKKKVTKKMKKMKKKKEKKNLRPYLSEGAEREYDVAKRLVDADADPIGYEYDYGNGHGGDDEEEWYEDRYIPSDEEDEEYEESDEEGDEEDHEEEHGIENKAISTYFTFTWNKRLPTGVASGSPPKAPKKGCEEEEEAKDRAGEEGDSEIRRRRGRNEGDGGGGLKKTSEDHHFSFTWEHKGGGW